MNVEYANTAKREASRIGALLLILSAGACGAAEQPGADGPAGEGADLGAAPAVWKAVSTGGTTLTVTPAALPVRAGLVELEIALEGERESAAALTVDLLSPEMPAHGIVRFPATALPHAGRFNVQATVPMEGRWALFVNLDEGGDYAELSFDALPGDGATGHEHTAPGSMQGHGDHTEAEDVPSGSDGATHGHR